MTIGIVTTFSDKGYDEYAHLLVSSMEKFMGKDIEVFLYIDDVTLKPKIPNIKLIRFEPSVPELVNFKNRNKHRLVKKFMFDGVRFSHKIYALWHAATNIDTSQHNSYKLFWLDADTIIQQNVDSNYFSKFLPEDTFTSYLGRPGRYTECGFVGYNLKHPAKTDFFNEMVDYYNTDRLYTDLPFFTDCHVYDATREKFKNEGKIKALDLTPGMGKSNFNHVHKGYMIHNKGEKKMGKSKGKSTK